MEKAELGLWTPLIGFDVTKEDLGVQEYLDNIGMHPDTIGLFVYNADIINYHEEGMPREKKFPADFCNYYGSPRNDLRERQDWTNYDLRKLASLLKEKGVETYISVMGNHLSPASDDDDTPQIGMFGYPVKQDFVMEHRELAIESTKERGYIHLLKRFRDGTSFGDYFIRKALACVTDYGIDGLHLADAIFPHSIQIQHGDFSDDLFGRFIEAAHICPPQELSLPLKDKNSPGVGARAAYVWKHHREAYLNFIADEWEKFFTKLCREFHAHGKKVMVNNAWTMAPFEAFYRFAVDYKSLERAGVDKICVEDQATILYLNDPGSRYKFSELTTAPAFIRAYAPHMKTLCINYAKDASEEGSIINHCPMADEREIYMLSSPLYLSKEGKQRVSQGFFVCLADSLSRQEWSWLAKRYEIAYRREEKRTLSATLVFSDNMVRPFLPVYMATRRYSSHKIVSDVTSFGGKMGAVVRADELESAHGLIFVPNIDLLSEEELDRVKKYPDGVVYTCVAARKPDLGKEDIYFEDKFEENAECRMCVGGLRLGAFERGEIEAILADCQPPRDALPPEEEIKEAEYWMNDLVYRPVSEGILKATARLLFLASQNIVRTDAGNLVTVYELENGLIRLVCENEMLDHYKIFKIYVSKRIRKIINGNDFPVLPPKLVLEGDAVRANFGDPEMLKKAIGFVVNLPPGGCSFVDLELE